MFYAVKKGRNIGIYNSWEDCKREVEGFSGAEYKKFKTYEEAKAFIEEESTDKNPSIDLNQDTAIAYIDGSFDLETHTFGFGAVIFYKGEKITFSQRYDDAELSNMRNVAGEIKGAEEVMKWALENNVKKLIVYYDYMGIENWALGKWKTTKAGTKAYKEFYDTIKDKLNVNFIKVKAHSGDEFNEEADKLAKNSKLL
ncbi:MAG: viroplasmin family protein [Tissierellales bacterium]|nr:viroplasmin family protein [Tissierellales bacterium]